MGKYVKKYEIEKYEKPVKMDFTEVKIYDVARFEYGDYDNWVNAIIIDVRAKTEQFGNKADGTPNMVTNIVIKFASEYGDIDKEDDYATAYSGMYDREMEIIGHATPLDISKLKEENNIQQEK